MNTPESIFDHLVSLDQPGAIDGVYDLILERTDAESRAVMCEMLALPVVAFEPFTVDDLEDLLKHAGVWGSGKAILQNLGSVLSADYSTNLIQFRHTTIVEYLRRRSVASTVANSTRIYINAVKAHGQAVSWCLQRLKSRTTSMREYQNSFQKDLAMPVPIGSSIWPKLTITGQVPSKET
ncbi:hypothetical protein PIIN_11044 [Serendipita indica DSM 11827]|uniref:Uncharacterized protein n=1 Tax=Serendipita indica (strain DSM 11827) TaxID=1109443 RepID=G4U0G6_SERID|nr:hypothetical protein PIIN_11044 [Serendipita indica DSM 11827]